MTRQRELFEAKRARDNARAQLAHEQAERRQWEAHYRAEHADHLAEVETERDEARGKLDAVRGLAGPYAGENGVEQYMAAMLAILDGKAD